jgi:hypothetical protein
MKYDNLLTAATKIEELVSQFHDTPGFGWYGGHLRQIVEEMRGQEKLDQWLESKKELGKLIDPATAEAMWTYRQILDPYGVERVPPEFDCVGRLYFFRNPGSEWVWEGDIPEATLTRLRERPVAGQESNDELPF